MILAGFILIAMGVINFALNPIAGGILIAIGLALQAQANRKGAT